MRRITPLLLVLSFCIVGGPSPSHARPFDLNQPISGLWQTYGHSFDAESPPPGQTPEQRSHWVIDQRAALGRTPASWLSWARSALRFDLPRHVTPAHQSLAGAIERLYSIVGVRVDPGMSRLLDAMPKAVPAFVSNSFAELVQTVADVYDAQAPLSRTVIRRLGAGFDPYHPALHPDERDAMLEREHAIVNALNLFRARTSSWFRAHQRDANLPCGVPIFSDPEGLVILGSMCNDAYGPKGLFGDPVLLVDPGGSNTFTNSAGGACPAMVPNTDTEKWMRCNGLVVSVVASLGQTTNNPNADTFSYNGGPAPVQGAAGPGGIGMLVKVAGRSTMNATMTRSSSGPFDPFNLVPYLDAGAQGFGYAGAGLLLEGTGGQHLHSFTVRSTQGQNMYGFGQGFGGLGGVGIASDLQGSNAWISNAYGTPQANPSREGFVGLYTAGTGFYEGVGILSNTGKGQDVYRATAASDNVDFYALGFATFGGLGVLADDGGDDTYYTKEQSLASTGHPNPILNCAIGSASYGGVGVVIAGDGNDSYYGASIAPSGKGAYVMDNGFGGPGAAYGIFVKHGGDDSYTMQASGSQTKIAGRGLYEPSLNDLNQSPPDFPIGINSFGTFVDIGGHDTFHGGPGAPNSEWAVGVDHE